MPDSNGANGHPSRIPDIDVGRRFLEALYDVDLDIKPEPGWPVIPGYRLVRQLGRGGGGNVFLGLRDGSENLCAVKVIHRHVTDESHAKRAWRELDVLQRLKLPFVPRVLDYGIHEGRLYFASDFIEGSALDAHCNELKLPIRDRVEILERLARQVQQLHEQGVSHRDLKPSNVIVDLQGDCHIIDFGIANLVAEEKVDTITETGSILGSPAYMAPEQARGDRRLISTRSDVYTLGAIGYKILTGEPPHASTGQPHVLLRRVASEPARSPRSIDPQLPRPIDAVLINAVEFDPTSRIPTALELADELRRWLDGEPVRSHRINPLAHLWLGMKRRPALAAVTTLAIVALAASIFLGAMAVSNARSAKRITALKEQQDSIILSGIAGLTQSLDEQRFKRAMQYLNALELFRESGLTKEEYLSQLDGTRRNLIEAVLEAAYGIEDLEQSDVAESFDRLVSELSEAGAQDVVRK